MVSPQPWWWWWWWWRWWWWWTRSPPAASPDWGSMGTCCCAMGCSQKRKVSNSSKQEIIFVFERIIYGVSDDFMYWRNRSNPSLSLSSIPKVPNILSRPSSPKPPASKPSPSISRLSMLPSARYHQTVLVASVSVHWEWINLWNLSIELMIWEMKMYRLHFFTETILVYIDISILSTS